jgi:hypothetical protein
MNNWEELGIGHVQLEESDKPRKTTQDKRYAEVLLPGKQNYICDF